MKRTVTITLLILLLSACTAIPTKNSPDEYTRAIVQDVSGATDVTGYNYGKEFVPATKQGHWVSYMYVNPESDEQVRKHTWGILFDGLTFCSGWYE